MLQFFETNKITPRKEQISVLEKVKENFDRYKFFALSLPTGVGKTFIATAIADFSDSAYVMTSTLQLQEQYKNSWDQIVNLKGKSNYQCNMNSNFTTDFAPCTGNQALLGYCKATQKCSYYNQKNAALASKAMITNPAYMLYSSYCGVVSGDDPWVQRKVMIVDEAHNLEEHLVSFASSEIDVSVLKEQFKINGLNQIFFGSNKDDNVKTVERLLRLLQDKAAELAADAELGIGSGNGDHKAFARSFDAKKAAELKRKHAIYNQLDKVIQPLVIFTDTYKGNNWIIQKVDGKNAITLKPIYADFLFDQFLNKLGEKFIFLSATLGTKKEFCQELGIPEDQCMFIEEDSPFKPEKSPIVILPTIKLSRDHYNESVKKVGEIVNELMNVHKDHKGIIHCVTYDLQKHIWKGVSKANRERLLCRDMEEMNPSYRGYVNRYKNADLLRMHEKSGPTVLLSPSMMEGVDLAGDASRFQIIIKLPWANLGDARVKEKARISNDWYSNKMWLNVMQASGRSTRNEEDSSVTYILDDNFDFFYRKWQAKLPGWFTSRIKKIG